jgi:hypothetical protein
VSKKPKKSGTCVICLQASDRLTDEHVFPAAWYPDTTPDNLERWKVPSCYPCNNEYSKLEGELLFKLGLCIDRSDARAAGIGEKALRSMDPKFSKSEKDRRARQARRDRLRKELLHAQSLSDEGFFPNFGPKGGQLGQDRQHKLFFSGEHLQRLVDKLVRGTTYYLDLKLIPLTHEIESYFVEEAGSAHVLEPLLKQSRAYYRGPGIGLHRGKVEGDPLHAFFRFEIWGKLVLHASVRPRESTMADQVNP